MEQAPEKRIFAAALEHAPESRSGFLDRACGGDDALRGRVEALLSAYDTADAFLEEPPVVAAVGEREDTAKAEAGGERIGCYRLLQEIGEGGFGVVWMAEQEEPVRRKVALKVIKRGMDTKQVVARFEAERQALALMDHPNIAKVLDGGETPGGRPYFVMELVKGIPITEFCDAHKLDTNARLALFRDVCAAVQHAHQKGIIHRDLKPSNVLVTLLEAEPAPKVIDFGVAKATSAELTRQTLFTEFRQMVGTPEYMAPEQADLSSLDVDTRADIYSLGVLLYELLTGSKPFDFEAVLRKGYAEMMRVIKEEDPPRPSTRVSTGAAKASEAAVRRVEPARLGKLLRGDLDWIVMKALEKDRSRRYESASGFAADIGRYLGHEPVTAGPPSASYRLRKFVRRNRASVIATALLCTTLILGVAGTTWGMVWAFDEKDRADGEAQRANLAAQAEGRARRDADANAAAASAAKSEADERAEEAERRAYRADIATAEAALQAGNVDEVRNRLDGWDGDRRGWEWYRLMAACDDSFAALPANSYWFRDGRVATAADDDDHVIRVHDVTTGAEVAVLRGHEAKVRSLHLGPDGNRLASGSADRTARIWDLEKGTGLHLLHGHTAAVLQVRFSPDGALVASTSADKTARLWDTTTGAAIAVLRGHEQSVYSVTFAPDGGLLATTSRDNTVRLWTLDGRQRAVLAHASSILGIDFSPDGRRLASTSWGGTARLWDVQSGREIAVLLGNASQGRVLYGAGQGQRLQSISFSPDGSRLVSTCLDEAARVWDASTGGAMFALAGRDGTVKPTAWSDDGSRLAAGSGRLVQIWEAKTGSELAVLLGHEADVTAVRFSSDGERLVTASEDHTVRLWDGATGAQIAVFLGHTSWVENVSISTDGSRLVSWQSTYPNGTVRILDAERSSALALEAPDGFKRVAFAPDGARIASSVGHVVHLWDAVTGAKLVELPGHIINSPIAYSPDGTLLASTGRDNKTVRLWDTATGLEVAVLGGLEHGARSVAFSPDGALLATGAKSIRLWSTATREEVATIGGPEVGYVRSVRFSPDRSRIAGGCADGKFRVWDVKTGAELALLAGAEPRSLLSAAYSPDGALLATSSRLALRLWDAKTHAELAMLERPVGVITFAPDSARLVCRFSGVFLLADPARGETVAVLRSHGSLPQDASYSPDGTRLVSAYIQGPLRVFDTVPESVRFAEREAMRAATRRVGPLVDELLARPLAPAEIVALVRADRSLDEVERRAAENELLRRGALQPQLDAAAAYSLLDRAPAEAEPHYRAALDGHRRWRGDEHHETLSQLAGLGIVLVRLDRHREAEPILRECLAGREKILDPDDWRLVNTRIVLGASLAGQGRFTEAEPLLVDAYENLDPARAGARHKREARQWIVELYEAWHRAEPAAGHDANAARWK